MKKLCLGLAAAAVMSGSALADNVEFPAYVPYPFKRSHMTRRVVRIVPYRNDFHVRVFTTPQKPPYYNVPSYPVISPF